MLKISYLTYMTALQASVEAFTPTWEDMTFFSCFEAIMAFLNMDPKSGSGSESKQFLQSFLFLSVIYSGWPVFTYYRYFQTSRSFWI